ncbi:efflux RND transporter periplasmic adaptor subunit [Virgibacillus ndiopensis]|uniref:efflux RND transporter periplasmic adaptor subunit n=1 Tax=Virgibacillus ndiopensis TaxID=2004408 RepID=UPI000C06A51D|nr:efflux RND transporter periplasmic adaptor subunit [Virgibacillus ndiopensis]
MKRRRVIMSCIVLFIAVNVVLIAFDKDGKVDRKSYVKDWSETFKADMFVKMDKDGVLASVKENNVYFDKELGTFQEFLVEEGTQVNVGDELFTYRANNYYETRQNLESEQEQINGELDAIEMAISTMSTFQVPQINLHINDDEGKQIGETTLPSVESEYMKKQYLAEKEKELAQKTAQLESVQSQLTELEASGEIITVKSAYAGKVSMLSQMLSDPIITIQDAQLHAIGELAEEERLKIEQGMAVEITVKENQTFFQGSINKVDELPKEVEINGPSVYPFNVTFSPDSEIENLLPGFHTNLAITIKKSLDATVAMEEALFGNHLWTMTDEGKLHKQEVETGIKMNNKSEITKGVKPGELVAEASNDQFRSEATFITPLKLEHIQWNKIFDSKDKNRIENIVTGILSR